MLNGIIICSDDRYFSNPLVKNFLSILETKDVAIRSIYVDKGFFSFQRIMKTVFIIGLRGLFKLRSIPTQSSLSDISKEHGIPLRVFDPAEIEKEKVDIIWVFNLGRILRKPVLQMPSKGCVNLHFGLLPHYRGIMPSFWAHYHGEPFLGITYYKMDEGIDTGPVICQTQIPICSKMNLVDIYQKGFDQAACMIEEVFTCLSGDLLLKQEEAAGPGSYFMMPTWRDIILYKIKFFPYSI